MGSKLFAADMILNDMIKPMNNAYQFKDYPTACGFLDALEKFLKGYGEGISDMPPKPEVFDNNSSDILSRTTRGNDYNARCKRYFEKYYPIVMQRVGLYIKAVLDAIERDNNPYGRN